MGVAIMGNAPSSENAENGVSHSLKPKANPKSSKEPAFDDVAESGKRQAKAERSCVR